jgi:hypothetical protein
MNKVYLHKPLASDELLGRVSADGKVYEARLGPDVCVGRVDLNSGRVYEARLGPDDYCGRIDPEDGKIYFPRLGLDEYLARVEDDGRIFAHAALAPDPYVGKLVDMVSRLHAGAAYLLLILPRLEEERGEESLEEDE